MPNMGKESLTARILCPFYRDHCRKKPLIYVRCEGAAMRTFVRVCFPSEKALEKHLNGVCCEKWQECPYAAAANDKYEDLGRRLRVRRWHKRIVYRRRPPGEAGQTKDG